jgi:hypothetical protein
VSALNTEEDLTFRYLPSDKLIKIVNRKELKRIVIYDILGNVHVTDNICGNEYIYQFNGLTDGMYLARILYEEGKVNTV